MDEKDREIVGLLQGEGRASYAEVARRTELSETAVRNRMDRMERDGVILGYSAVVDPAALGYRSVTYLGLEAEPERFLEAVKVLNTLDEVKWVATATGDHTIIAEVWTTDDSALTRFIEEQVETIPGVTRACPTIVKERVN